MCTTISEVHDRIVEPFEGGYAAYNRVVELALDGLDAAENASGRARQVRFCERLPVSRPRKCSNIRSTRARTPGWSS